MEGSATVSDCAMCNLPPHHLSGSLVQDAATNCRVTDTVGDPTKSRKRRRRSGQPSSRGRVPPDVTALMPRVASGEHQGSDPDLTQRRPALDHGPASAGGRSALARGPVCNPACDQRANQDGARAPETPAAEIMAAQRLAFLDVVARQGPRGGQMGSQEWGRPGGHRCGGRWPQVVVGGVLSVR